MSERDNTPRSNAHLVTKDFSTSHRQQVRRELLFSARADIVKRFATVTRRSVQYEIPRRARRKIAGRLSKVAWRNRPDAAFDFVPLESDCKAATASS